MSTHSSHGDEEIDREPEPSISEGGEDVEHEVEVPNDPAIQPATTHHAPTKINLKLITMEPFTGEVRDGYFDAGAHEWFERLQAQIEDAENLNGLSWSEPLKCINVEADDASEEMETAINLLSRLAGNDGRMRKRHYDTGSGSRTGSANAGVSSNNSKKQRWDFSNALCRTCNQRGHTTNYHDRFVAQQQRGQPEHSTTGMAAAAAQPSDEK
ncbi:hypothetical protein AM587_10001977 [Phytophthora nicotianae]|uniref:Uncharacterized protein n=1 Tax=Phytophthora nicotianae TaxID=4792 RepID=A0A0W8CF20_PHYNI|nr:hypothetical protein AM587_10001977 [Phytophthora nicotianae]